MSKKRWAIVAIVVIVVVTTGWLTYLRWIGMPLVAWNALNNADRYELLSLKPYPSKQDYYGHEILGSMLVGDSATRERLNRALQTGVRASDGTMMHCFNPRHGIRVSHGGTTTEFVICFECRQVQVWQGNVRVAFFLVSDSPQAEFDNTLKTAGVSLDRDEK